MFYNINMQKGNRLKFTDPAPDMELLSTSGETLLLSSLWSQGTLLLAFTRHFGCPQCKEMLDELGQYGPALRQAGIKTVAITQAKPVETAAFCAQYASDLTCLSDPQRKAYTAFGLGRGSLSQTLFSLRVYRANAQVRSRKGWNPKLPPPGQDAMLMSGIFIIGMDGRIRLPYYYDDIADHPSLDLLLHGILGVDWNRPFDGPIAAPTTQPSPKD
jgi:peroxiredoxin